MWMKISVDPDQLATSEAYIHTQRELSGSVLDLRPRGHRFAPHQCHCVVVFEQDTFILA